MATILSMLANNVNEALNFILPALSKNTSRPNLTHCHIKHTGNRAVFTGMDGYTIKQIAIGTLTDTDGVEEYLIPAETVKELIKQTKEKKRSDWLIALEASKIQLYDAGNLQQELRYSVTEDLQYVDVDRIFKNMDFTSFSESVAVQPKLLASAIKGFQLPKVKVGGKNDPIWVIDLEGAPKQAIVMPMRLKDNITYHTYSGESL